ncbi:MAG: helix-turn-helix domain-containing protein [Lachnospiraceae bacterium]|jgi:transcriptional regulator with XRE-family HTH domain|nr:helix-turn-helix domain-containing protein [Lachnospiraceae bacterium]
MELSKQIKRYRTEMNLSQEELAEKIFVTRQTISNWENEKNYPDIHSILRLTSLFGVSLEQLIKGDLAMMREEIKAEDIKKLGRYNIVLTVFMAISILSSAPLIFYGRWVGVIIFVIMWSIEMVVALKVEKFKKKHDIQTFREIMAFANGERLDEIEKNHEAGKRIYQKILLAMGAGLVAAVVSGLVIWLISLFN